VNPDDPLPHAHDDELHLYIFGRLSAAEVDVLERHLSECAECTERLGATAQLVAKILNLSRDEAGTDRRTEPRFYLSDVVFLRSLSPALPDRWPVQIIDVSKSGLGLLVPLRLSPGVVVQIQSGTTFALGEVRHSRQISENKFHTGVRLQDVIAVRRPISAGPPVGDKS
jgi:Putative zinc-finger